MNAEKDQNNQSERETLLFEKARAGLRTVIDEGASVPEKAYAARKLADVLNEMRIEFGAAMAGGLFRSIMKDEKTQSPASGRKQADAEFRAISAEMDNQARRLN